jgi:general stress protein 26
MNDTDRSLDEVLEGERIAMFVTADRRARPMAILEHEGATLWFLTDRTAHWVEGMDPGERVTVAISDPQDATFVSLSGSAHATTDQARIDELWSPTMQAWFDGREDPDLVALRVEVDEGEYWDGPGSGVGRTLRGIAGAVLGDGRRTMGQQGSVVADDDGDGLATGPGQG